MIKFTPEISPQHSASKITGIDHRKIGMFLSRGNIETYEVCGERWVSIAELEAWVNR